MRLHDFLQDHEYLILQMVLSFFPLQFWCGNIEINH